MHPTLLLLAAFQLAVTLFLPNILLISATPSPSTPDIQQRGQLPQGWSSVGCWTDDPSLPTLTSIGNRDSFNMTVEECVALCNGANMSYAGLENGIDCHCGNVLTIGSTSAPASDCNSTCIGDHSEACGGSGSLSLYWNGVTQAQPTIVQSVNGWNFLGCYSDSSTARSLTVQAPVSQYNTSVESCTEACKAEGYSLAGMEFAQQCFCDHSIQHGGQMLDVGRCPLACSGNTTEICGGASSLVVYSFTSS